jgi:hypothetical protein
MTIAGLYLLHLQSCMLDVAWTTHRHFVEWKHMCTAQAFGQTIRTGCLSQLQSTKPCTQVSVQAAAGHAAAVAARRRQRADVPRQPEDWHTLEAWGRGDGRCVSNHSDHLAETATLNSLADVAAFLGHVRAVVTHKFHPRENSIGIFHNHISLVCRQHIAACGCGAAHGSRVGVRTANRGQPQAGWPAGDDTACHQLAVSMCRWPYVLSSRVASCSQQQHSATPLV